MTIDALQSPVERPRDEYLERLAIGEPDSNIFLCPRCARPLAAGVSRCGGCRSRLVAGVQLVKVAGFVALGLAVGLALGGGGVGLFALTRPSGEVIVAPPPVTAPSSAPVASGVPNPLPPAIPSAALSALRQSTVLNQRLLSDADLLDRALAARNPSSSEIAPILRGLASTAAFGVRLAPTVSTWDQGQAVSQGLAAFYGSIGRIADQGLSASLSNEPAYLTAGRRMRSVLDRLTDLDAASRGLAASAGVELPPLVPAK